MVYIFVVLVLDYRPVEGIVNEDNGTVEVCVYVCDGLLKREASITVTFLNGTAQCMFIFSYMFAIHRFPEAYFILF